MERQEEHVEILEISPESEGKEPVALFRNPGIAQGHAGIEGGVEMVFERNPRAEADAEERDVIDLLGEGFVEGEVTTIRKKIDPPFVLAHGGSIRVGFLLF